MTEPLYDVVNPNPLRNENQDVSVADEGMAGTQPYETSGKWHNLGGREQC